MVTRIGTQRMTTPTADFGHRPEGLVHLLEDVLNIPSNSEFVQALELRQVTCIWDLLFFRKATIDTLEFYQSQPDDIHGDPVDDILVPVFELEDETSSLLGNCLLSPCFAQPTPDYRQL